MKIFKLTVEGILNTASRKLNDEKLNEERQSIETYLAKKYKITIS